MVVQISFLIYSLTIVNDKTKKSGPLSSKLQNQNQNMTHYQEMI